MNFKMVIILLYTSTINSTYFPFYNNRNKLKLCIDCVYGPIFTSREFIFNKRDTVLIHLDGYISFDPCELYQDNCDFIQIYKINSTAKGYIFYEEITNTTRLNNISAIIRTKYEFTANWAFQLTWYNIYKTKSGFKEKMSFQLIVTHNNLKSFVIFNYIYLDFNRNISIGYKIGNYSYYENYLSSQLVNESNVDKKGLWVLQLPNNGSERLRAHVFIIILILRQIKDLIF